VHISGIGSDARSTSPYIRSRGKGEAAVLDAFPSATLIRPAVMFGPGDAFITPLLSMIRQKPVFPMFGAGTTRLQPAYVEDVAEAITRTLQLPTTHSLYELAGPNIYTYAELLRTLAAALGRRPLLLPFHGTQYHPEHTLAVSAALIEMRAAELVEEGFGTEPSEIVAIAADYRALNAEPTRRDLIWRYGLASEIMDPLRRTTEIGNWLRTVVVPRRF